MTSLESSCGNPLCYTLSETIEIFMVTALVMDLLSRASLVLRAMTFKVSAGDIAMASEERLNLCTECK